MLQSTIFYFLISATATSQCVWSWAAIWISAPENRQTPISGLALVMAAESSLYPCSIKAVWGETVITANVEKNPALDIVFGPSISEDWSNVNDWQANKTVKITPEWAEKILSASVPYLSDGGPYFLFDGLMGSQFDLQKLDETVIFEPSISALVAAGMSRVAPASHVWTNHLDLYFPGRRTEQPPRPSDSGQLSTTIKSYYVGAGYTLQGSWTRYLASAVLLLYSAIVITYFLSSVFIAGYSSNAWGSMAELTALALRSRPPRAMESTSAGIQAMSTYRQPVGIRPRENGLELVFMAEEPDLGSLNKVKSDEFY